MKTKSFPAKVKATEAEGLEPGQFEAIVSVFNTVDSYGDMVIPGAFTDTLKAWADRGDPIPVIFAHQWNNPEMHIGVVLAAEERPEGLWVRGQLDIEDEDAKTARRVNKLMKGRRVTQFSFAYDEVEAGWTKKDDREFYELRKVDLFEVGPCLVGVNQETELLGAKSIDGWFHQIVTELKAGRVLSAANEGALRSALEKIAGGITDVESVLAALETDDGKATANPVDPPAASKAATWSTGDTPATARLLADLAAMELELPV